jgi:hypothetical protein
MATYRLLWRDQRGHMAKSAEIQCSSDQAAMETATRQTGSFASIELWDGERCIGLCGNPKLASP